MENTRVAKEGLKFVHKLPLKIESQVLEEYEAGTGRLLCHYIKICFVPDGRVDLKPKQRVRVTIEKFTP